MNLYVTIEVHQGVIGNVHVFQKAVSAKTAHRQWQTAHGIRNEIDRQCQEMNGIEFHLLDCKLED